MSDKLLVVIADADTIVAQAVSEDSNHQLAIRLGKKLEKKGANIIYPATAIAEAVTSLQRKFSNPHLAALTLENFINPQVLIDTIDGKSIREAKELFDPNRSKKNTLFDCIVATLAKKHNADGIFSFDSWYKKLGFKLVSDLL